jgi:transposase
MDDRSLYEAILGLKAPWFVARVEVKAKQEEVWVWVEPSQEAELTCPECGVASPGYDRADERRWRHLDTCQFRTILVSNVPRVRCATHGVRQVKVPWADDRGRFTSLFEAWAIRLLEETTVQGTADLLGISWDEASGIMRRAVNRGLLRRQDDPLKVLGIDETSFQKRHEYVTVVADLERDRVLWVGEARRQSTLETYWRTLPESERRDLSAIVMDMWDPYIAATRGSVPDGLGKIVFDRFHVMQHVNRAVDDVRRAEQRELRVLGDFTRLENLRGTRYLWLRGARTRSDDDQEKIEVMRRAGFKVGRAWAIKEAVADLWSAQTRDEGMKIFTKWYGWVARSRLPAMKKAAKTLKHYLSGILAYIEQPYTNAMTEGLNSKIQEIKYRARGYRNRENFRLAILFHCGKLYMSPL